MATNFKAAGANPVRRSPGLLMNTRPSCDSPKGADKALGMLSQPQGVSRTTLDERSIHLDWL